jgi:hypothetical protein
MQIQTLAKKKKLHLLPGINRPVCPSQVTKLADSINRMGNIRPIVVAELEFIDGRLLEYVIDGQHLLHALIRNNLPIEYVKITISSIEDLIEKIALLNSSSKSWKLSDYVNSWAYINKDYRKLNKYFNIYDFELSFLAAVLSNREVKKTAGGDDSVTSKLKSGRFEIVNEKTNVEILNNLTDILKIIPRLDRVRNRYVCSEYVAFYRTNIKTYNHDKFLKSLSKNKEKFILATHETDQLVEMFEKLI